MMAEIDDNNTARSEAAIPRIAFITLLILILANISSLLDRSIMSLMVQPIKQDLGISDVQFGLLHGFAFALLYSVLGVPIGWLVDKFNRIRIVAAGIAIWSFMTAMCGFAYSFLTLFFARMGVGVGEATLNPAAYSLLSDSFPRRFLARAVGAFMMATYIGVGLSYLLGGILVSAFEGSSTVIVPLLGEIRTWKAIFFIAAFPGFIIALGILFIREPKRTGLKYNNELAGKGEGANFEALFGFLRKNKRSLITHFFGFVGTVTFANGLLLWAPTMIHTNHGVPIGTVGQQFGLLLIVVGGTGPFLGGWLADAADKRGIKSAPIKAAILLSLLAILPAALFPWMSSLALAYVFISFAILLITGQIGLAITALQLITPNELRGQISAIFLMLVNIIGIGFGPALFPLLAQILDPASPDLRMSVSILGCIAGVLSILSLSAGIKAYQASDARMGFE